MFTAVQIEEYLSRVAARVETNGPTGYEKRNLGQMCHALVCRRTKPAENTMPLISLELPTQKVEILHTFRRVIHTFWV